MTLVPALAARGRPSQASRITGMTQGFIAWLHKLYLPLLKRSLHAPWRVVALASLLLGGAGLWFVELTGKQEFLPTMDDGRVQVNVTTDAGASLDDMDRSVHRLEAIARQVGDVAGISVVAGGTVFGRSQRERPNRSSLNIELTPLQQRGRSIEAWVEAFSKAVAKAEMAGVKVRAKPAGLRGVRVSSADDPVSIRVRGSDLDTLAEIGDRLVKRVREQPGLRNVQHSAEEQRLEFSVRPDRARAAELDVDVEQIGHALRIALDGLVIGDYLEGDRAYDVRIRLPQEGIDSPAALAALPLFGATPQRPAIQLGDIASIELDVAPTEIRRQNQARIVEVSAALTGERPLGEVLQSLRTELDDFALPAGYSLYYGGAFDSLQRGNQLVLTLAGLALFLVFVVMAVQYESLRNPVVILLGVPFALIGVAIGLHVTALPISMPVWLGVIMLIGVVVNNAIVLIEYVELSRRRGVLLFDAIMEAARLRLRPILMTTLTTAIGMSPLAFGFGEGSEMLRPLAVCMVFGLLFSMLVTLLLIPSIYLLAQPKAERAAV
jgi:multidrug efflux pump subunit AcrB